MDDRDKPGHDGFTVRRQALEKCLHSVALEEGSWGRREFYRRSPRGTQFSANQFRFDPVTTQPELEILRIGSDGDGIAFLRDGTSCYCPETLPAERVRARLQGRRGKGWSAAVKVLRPSPDRVSPACPHFGAAGGNCGGCTLQHWRDDTYAEWKSGQVAEALRRAGAEGVPQSVLARTPPGARRRMDLAMRRDGQVVKVGLHARRSREVVDMHACPVLHPTLFALIAPLRALLAGLTALRREGSAVVNLLDAGADVLLRTDVALSPADRIRLVAFARAQDVPRLSWARGPAVPEPVCILRPPVVSLGGATVAPPSGAFLQASLEGEISLQEAVSLALAGQLPARGRIVELFAGCGTLTATLARHARVDAFEGDPLALAALHQARIPRVAAHRRDLARQPLTPAELRGAVAVVLDPPWAGAAAQMPALAASGVKLICYVSCNPAALTRDATILLRAGYRVATVSPVDQFVWSAQVESVCVFTRDKGA